MYKKTNDAGWVETRDNIKVCMSRDGTLLITTESNPDIIEVPLKSLLKNVNMYLTKKEINQMKIEICKIVMKI